MNTEKDTIYIHASWVDWIAVRYQKKLIVKCIQKAFEMDWNPIVQTTKYELSMCS